MLAGQVGAYPQEAKAAKDAAERQGEKPHANGSPRSYLEAAPLSSRATTGSRVHSAASYSAADCWATSKGDDMEQEGDEEHGSEMLESSGDDEAGVTLRRSGRNHRTDSKRVRAAAAPACMVPWPLSVPEAPTAARRMAPTTTGAADGQCHCVVLPFGSPPQQGYLHAWHAWHQRGPALKPGNIVERWGFLVTHLHISFALGAACDVSP